MKNSLDFAWIVVAIIGGLIIVDGIGSILIQNGQFHGFWFDIERGFRTLAGLILIVLAVWRIRRDGLTHTV
jgi:hypothetical protein